MSVAHSVSLSRAYNYPGCSGSFDTLVWVFWRREWSYLLFVPTILRPMLDISINRMLSITWTSSRMLSLLLSRTILRSILWGLSQIDNSNRLIVMRGSMVLFSNPLGWLYGMLPSTRSTAGSTLSLSGAWVAVLGYCMATRLFLLLSSMGYLHLLECFPYCLCCCLLAWLEEGWWLRELWWVMWYLLVA